MHLSAGRPRTGHALGADRTMDWKSKRIRTILENALLEDKAASDISTALLLDPSSSPAVRGTGTIFAKEACTVAGLGAISTTLEIFGRLAPQLASRFEVVSHPEIFDGVRVRAGQPLAVIRHTAAAILATERTLLNLLARMCGIATLTQAYVQAIKGTGAEVLDTRKTSPGIRPLDHYAVCCGGGLNHRQDLADGVLLKSNHIRLGGGMRPTLDRALARRQPGQKVQVEVRSLEELTDALAAGVDSILLDNLSPEAVRAAVRQIRSSSPALPIEASGGISLANVRAYAEAGVNYVTIGSLTHSAPAADLSLRLSPDAS